MIASALLLLASFAVDPTTQRPDPAAPPPAAPAPEGRGPKKARDDKGPPVLAREDVEQAEGKAGDLPPLVQRLERSIASVTNDTLGRGRPELAGLVACKDGFAALISDERDGPRSYFLQRLDRELAPLSEPERIDDRASGKGQWGGSLAIAASDRLGAVWLDVGDRETALRGRWWDAEGRPRAPSWSVPLPATRPEIVASTEVSLGPQPALVWSPTLCIVAWNTQGSVLLRELDPAGPDLGRLQVLGRRSRPATSAARPAIAADGSFACAYDVAGAIIVHLRLGADEPVEIDLGPGKLLGIAADSRAAVSSWWIVLRKQGRLFLRHLDQRGATDRADVALLDQPCRSAELGVGAGGLCVLVQPGGGGLDALWVGDEASGYAVARSELRPAGTPVVAARLVSDGERWAFMWTERNGPLAEVFACTSAPSGTELSPARTFFAANGSAAQDQPAAAFAAERGAVAWTDQRFGNPVIGVRGISSERRLGADELFLPADPGAANSDSANQEVRERAPGRRPAIALHPSGRGLVAWIGAVASGANVMAQALEVGVDGNLRASAAALEVEPEPFDIASTFAPSVLALRGGGFALAWVRAAPPTGPNPRVSAEDGRSELRLVRVGLDGHSGVEPRTVATGSRLAHPALAQLDDGRIALAWDAQPHARERRLAARVFSERLEPELRELCFETMWRNSDHSPAIVAAGAGFALAWTSGEDLDSDVFARVYDGDGRPLSRPLALSPVDGGQRLASLARSSDGSFVAVWQDDLSNDFRLVGRRFSTRVQQLGAPVRFSFGPEPRTADFSNPQLCALDGDRLLLVGSHIVSGKGREIGMSVLGLGWDQVEGR